MQQAVLADGTLAYTPKATVQRGENRDENSPSRQVEK